MNIAHVLGVLALVALGSQPVAATDLSKIDRSIAKEPAYQSKPKYCLVVFGPEATTRVWLVVDGDTLYVDRNGNGDLTEKGKRVVLALDEYDRKRGRRVWSVGDIETPGDKGRYTGFQVSEISETATGVTGLGAGYGVAVTVPMAGHRVLQGVGGFVYPHHGFRLRFAARAQDAPIIHFGGLLRMILLHPERLTAGLKTGVRYEIEARVGTPGLGKDTAALINEDVPFGASSDALPPLAVTEFDFTDRQGRQQRLRDRLVFD